MTASHATDLRCRELADLLVPIAATGLTLDQDTLHFLHSTYGIDTADDLTRFLGQGTGCDQESLLECALFPDAGLRCRVEPLLNRESFSPRDIDATAAILAARIPQIALHWPGETAVLVEMTAGVARTFLTRLKIHRRLPPSLVQTVHDRVQEGLQQKVLVRFRDMRIEPADDSLEALIAFIKAFPASYSGFEDYLDLICRLLEEKQPGEDVFSHLILTKLVLEKGLDRAEHLEEMLARQPLEAILMQRTNILSINRPQIRKEMQMIDDIGLRLFGRIPDSSQLQSTFALKAFDLQG